MFFVLLGGGLALSDENADPGDHREPGDGGVPSSDATVNESSGTAGYSIPIAVLPGPGGFTPTVVLRYTSSLVDGAFGVGWELATGEIRCASRFGAPSRADQSSPYTCRRFELDGQLLVEAPEVGPGYREFRTSVDTFKRIRLHSTGAFAGTWEVARPDGTIARYGEATTTISGSQNGPFMPSRLAAHASSELDVVWKLTSETDSFGNRIDYGYGASTGVLYPHVIEYAGGSRRILIDYEARPDPVRDFAGGIERNIDRRAREIAVLNQSAVVSRTRLRYDPGPADAAFETGRSRLLGVTRIGSDCSVAHDECSAMNEIVFDYTRNELGETASAQWSALEDSDELWLDAQGTPTQGPAMSFANFADVNGDGRQDIIEARCNLDQWPCDHPQDGTRRVWLKSDEGWRVHAGWTAALTSLVVDYPTIHVDYTPDWGEMQLELGLPIPPDGWTDAWGGPGIDSLGPDRWFLRYDFNSVCGAQTGSVVGGIGIQKLNGYLESLDDKATLHPDLDWKVVDLNGDGLSDLVFSSSVGGVWVTHHCDGTERPSPVYVEGAALRSVFLNVGYGWVPAPAGYADSLPDFSRVHVSSDAGMNWERVSGVGFDAFPGMLPDGGEWDNATSPDGPGGAETNQFSPLCAVLGLSTAGSRFLTNPEEAAPCFASLDFEPQFVELNGDGLLDLIVLTSEDPRMLPYNGSAADHRYGIGRLDLGSNPTHSRAYLQAADGSGFVRASDWDLPFSHVGLYACSGPTCGAAILPNDEGIRIVDLNGDGLSDVIWTDPAKIFPPVWSERRLTHPPGAKGVLINTGSGWCASAEWGSGGESIPGECAADGIRYEVPDGYEFAMRGCARHLAELANHCIIANAGLDDRDRDSAYVYTVTRPLHLTDLNGDGLLDLTIAEEQPGPSGTAQLPVLHSRAWLFDPAAPSGWDVDDDRYALPISTSRGTGFRLPIGGLGPYSGVYMTKWLDVNDDGIADIVGDSGFFWTLPTSGDSPSWATSIRALPDLLRRIDNGRGGTTELTYTTAMRASEDDRACVWNAIETNLECIAIAHGVDVREFFPTDRTIIERWTRNPVVTSIKTSGLNQTDDFPATTYRYAHPRWSRLEKSSLGFRLVERQAPDGTVEQKLFYQDHGRSGALSRREVFRDATRETALRCERTEIEIVSRPTSPHPNYFPGVYVGRPVETESYNVYGGECFSGSEQKGAVSATFLEYDDDDYGFNFVSTLTTRSPSRGELIERRTPFVPGNNYWDNEWTIGRVGRVELWSSSSPADLLSRTTYDYGTHGSETSSEVELKARADQSVASEFATTTTDYDAFGNVSRIVDPDGRRTEFCYDGDSYAWCPAAAGATHSVRVASRDNAFMISSYVVRDPATALPIEVHSEYSDEASRLFIRDSFGRVVATYLRPNDGGQDVLVSETDYHDGVPEPYREDFAYPDGATGDVVRTATVFDGFGGPWKVIEEVDPDGTGVRYRGRATWKDPGNHLTGRPKSIRETYARPCGDALCAGVSGAAPAVADPGDPVVWRFLDGLGRAARIESLDGIVMNDYRQGHRDRWLYSGIGLVTLDAVLARDGRGALTRRGFDGDHLVFSETCQGDPVGASQAELSTAACTNPETMLYDYTSDGLIETIYDAAIAGPGGDLADPEHRIRYHYDTAGRMTRLEDPDAGTTSNSFTPGGKIASTQNARLQSQTYSYDAIGRLIHIARSAPLEDDVTFTFRPNERQVATESTSAYSKTFTYDAFGRAAREARNVAGKTFLMDTRLDHLGRPRFIDYPVQDMLVMYAYEGAYLKEVCEVYDEALPSCNIKNEYYIEDVEYDALGRRSEVDYGASTRSFEYDARYYLTEQRVTQTAGNRSYQWAYSASLYDEVGNLRQASVEETMNFGTELDVSMSYAYDAQNRIDSWSFSGGATPGSKHFGYDACGNLTEHEGEPQEYALPDHAHGVSERVIAGESYGYDASGNVVSITGGDVDRYFRFDSSNRLICQGTGPGLCDVMSVRYDAAGDRIESIDHTSYGRSTHYFGKAVEIEESLAGGFPARVSVSAFGEQVAYRNFQRAELRRAEPAAFWSFTPRERVWGLLAALSLVLGAHSAAVGTRTAIRKRPLGAATVALVCGVIGLPAAGVAGGGGGPGAGYRRWLVTGSLGSGVLELSELGDRVRTVVFRPFGEEADAAGIATTEYGVLYAGHKKDPLSDLFYMGARWYESKAGRFMSIDPLIASAARAQSVNGYTYVENNPISLIDPTGRFAAPNTSLVCSGDCVEENYGEVGVGYDRAWIGKNQSARDASTGSSSEGSMSAPEPMQAAVIPTRESPNDGPGDGDSPVPLGAPAGAPFKLAQLRPSPRRASRGNLPSKNHRFTPPTPPQYRALGGVASGPASNPTQALVDGIGDVSQMIGGIGAGATIARWDAMAHEAGLEAIASGDYPDGFWVVGSVEVRQVPELGTIFLPRTVSVSIIPATGHGGPLKVWEGEGRASLGPIFVPAPQPAMLPLLGPTTE